MSRLLLFSALNYLFAAPRFLKAAFLLANLNGEIFSCILLNPLFNGLIMCNLKKRLIHAALKVVLQTMFMCD